ncbi:MAG: hypothetical protein M3R09_05390 [Actinomycetota bacterium]|nr:hypothetical protein [Actinomycetota bacterium]
MSREPLPASERRRPPEDALLRGGVIGIALIALATLALVVVAGAIAVLVAALY